MVECRLEIWLFFLDAMFPACPCSDWQMTIASPELIVRVRGSIKEDDASVENWQEWTKERGKERQSR